MNATMSVVYLNKKGLHFNMMEKCYFYVQTKLDNQLNDKNSVM